MYNDGHLAGGGQKRNLATVEGDLWYRTLTFSYHEPLPRPPYIPSGHSRDLAAAWFHLRL